MIMITDSFPDLKIEIKEKTPDILDGDGGEVDLFPEPAESFRQQTPVPCLNIIHQHVPVFLQSGFIRYKITVLGRGQLVIAEGSQ